MKKSVLPVLFLFLMLVSSPVFSAPLSGVYTIGGTAPDYTTFTAAVADLQLNGVNAKVTFNARPGVYSEHITINAVAGASAANTITFQAETGNAADVTLTYAASSAAGTTGTGDNWVIKLNGASYITFNKLTLTATGSTYSNVVYMFNVSKYDTIKNCILNAPLSSAKSLEQVLINLSPDQKDNSYHGVFNNILNGGSYGVHAQAGYPSTYVMNYRIESNIFNNQRAYGIYTFRALTAMIRDNVISSTAGNSSYYGIYVNIAFYDSIARNKIYHCPGNGIWYDNGEPHIMNNFIQIEGTGVNYGLTFTNINYSATTTDITNNTVLVLNTNPLSSAFYFPDGYDQPLNRLWNNCFVNRGGGYAVNIEQTPSVTHPNNYNIVPIVDYNNYYTTGTYIGKWGSTNCTTLANWQATLNNCGCSADVHSLNVNPSFVSDTDLHITVDNLRSGIPAPTAKTDIDNELRDPSTPNIGADEVPAAIGVKFTASDTVACAGATINFSDQSTGSPIGWQWTFNGGTPANSAAKNPGVVYNSAGTYNVKLVVTFAGGTDSLVKTGYIRVNPAANGGTVSAPEDSVCAGETLSLSVTGNVGTIQWQSGPNPGSFTNIGGATSTTYNSGTLNQTIYYRTVATNGNCTSPSGAYKVTVHPLPSAPTLAVADSTLCSPDSTLMVTSGNYSLYLWSNGKTGATVYASASGPYSVTGTDINGCSVSSAIVNISVYPVPSVLATIQGDTIICFSDSALITASTGFAAYFWSTGATTTSVYASQAGGYWLTATDNNGCTAVSNRAEVDVYQVLPVSVTVKGDTLSSQNAQSYQWYLNDSLIPGATSAVYVANQTGNYSVQITDDNGCVAFSSQVTIIITGISAASGAGLSIYPNPFTNTLSINAGNAAQIQKAEIYDMPGRMVFSGINISTSGLWQIDLSALPAGMYYVKVQSGTYSLTEKVVKQ